jgi:hypothetical protein
MEDIDSEGTDAQSESELAPCSFCKKGGTTCTHQVLWASQENCAWEGPLADATPALDEKLRAALGTYLGSSKRTEPGPVGCSGALVDWVSSATEEIEQGEEVEDARTEAYWIALADLTRGSQVTTVHWDSNGPGGGDTYTHVRFKDPAAGIELMLEKARADVLALERSATPQKKARSKR